jgi:hypothetical protein
MILKINKARKELEHKTKFRGPNTWVYRNKYITLKYKD